MLAAARLVLLSDPRGAILEVHGSWREAAQVPVGETLASWVAHSGAGPALDFLLELRREGAAFGYPLPISGAPFPALSFAGLMAGEYAWLVAAEGDRQLREACRELLSSVVDLPHRPSRDSCDLLHRLVTSVGGGRSGVGEVEQLAVASSPPPGGTLVSTAVLSAVDELLGLLAQAGMALFGEPLTADQARLAAAVAKKSDAISALLAEGASQGAGGESSGERVFAIESALEESVALHRALAARRQVSLVVELRRPLPRPRVDGTAGELWLDHLLMAAVDLAEPAGTLELLVDFDANTVRLAFAVASTIDTATGRLAVAKQIAEALGGTLSLKPAGQTVAVTARLPAVS